MNLSTLFFVFAFLPVSLILYLVCPHVCKNALLVLISFVFYAWGSPVYLLLLLLDRKSTRLNSSQIGRASCRERV